MIRLSVPQVIAIMGNLNETETARKIAMALTSESFVEYYRQMEQDAYTANDLTYWDKRKKRMTEQERAEKAWEEVYKLYKGGDDN